MVGEIKRRATGRPACALALALALAGAVTSAQAFTPPRGTPNLAKMTLQPSDLAPGAKPVLSSYFDPGAGLHAIAEYDRDWGATATVAGVKLQQLQTQITLTASTKWAQAVFGQIPSIYGASVGRATLISTINVLAGGSDATLKNARFSKLRSVGVGQQSFYESATIAVKGSTLLAGFAWVRVNAAFAFLVVVAPKPPLADSVTINLAKTLAAHMKAALAAH